MNEAIITIPGAPVPLQRPRLSKHRVYDAQKGLKNDACAMIRNSAVPTITKELYESPVRLSFEFLLPCPKSWPKYKKQFPTSEPHITKPDLDNLIKFYCDVCSGILYHDDKQVYTIIARKGYSESPRTVIKIVWDKHKGEML